VVILLEAYTFLVSFTEGIKYLSISLRYGRLNTYLDRKRYLIGRKYLIFFAEMDSQQQNLC
jgi:hypothetical protein